MAVLIVTDGPAKDQKFSLAGSRLTMVGRDAGCSFQIVEPQLSRCHLQIRHDEDKDEHFAIDFQSKNGVFVNGKKIESETHLNDKDIITIGGTSIVYSTDDALDAKRAFETWRQVGQGHLRTIADEKDRHAE